MSTPFGANVVSWCSSTGSEPVAPVELNDEKGVDLAHGAATRRQSAGLTVGEEKPFPPPCPRFNRQAIPWDWASGGAGKRWRGPRWPLTTSPDTELVTCEASGGGEVGGNTCARRRYRPLETVLWSTISESVGPDVLDSVISQWD